MIEKWNQIFLKNKKSLTCTRRHSFKFIIRNLKPSKNQTTSKCSVKIIQWMQQWLVSETRRSVRFSFSTSVLIKWQWIFVIAPRVTQCIYILLICGTCSNNFEFEIGFNLQFALSNNGDDAPSICVYSAWTAIGIQHRFRNDTARKNITLAFSVVFLRAHIRNLSAVQW